MAVVSNELKDRVVEKLQQGISILERHYSVHIDFPDVKYNVVGTTAGYARFKDWLIRLNPTLLVNQPDKFIERTVPHELAHLVCNLVYPEAHERKKIGTRWKRDVHGEKWQEIMTVLGVEDIARCHQYDVAEAAIHARTKTKYEYRCVNVNCAHTYVIGPKVHAHIQDGNKKNYHCAKCKSSIKLHTEYGKLSYTAIAQIRRGEAEVEDFKQPEVKTASQKLKRPTPGSKLYDCWMLYNNYLSRSRSYMIDVFVNEAGCTYKGASTYYSTCKRLYEAGVI